MAGISFEAGGIRRWRDRMAALAATSSLWPIGPVAEAAMALNWSRSPCGFGLAGLCYGQWPTHRSRMDRYAIDFSRSRRGVPHWLDVRGTPTLAVARGLVTHVVSHGAVFTAAPPGTRCG